jgi:hypothetical protein
MTIVPALPFTFNNGDIADAVQVDANFNSIVGAVNSGAVQKGNATDIFESIAGTPETGSVVGTDISGSIATWISPPALLGCNRLSASNDSSSTFNVAVERIVGSTVVASPASELNSTTFLYPPVNISPSTPPIAITGNLAITSPPTQGSGGLYVGTTLDPSTLYSVYLVFAAYNEMVPSLVVCYDSFCNSMSFYGDTTQLNGYDCAVLAFQFSTDSSSDIVSFNVSSHDVAS